jgi:hypothetical protein
VASVIILPQTGLKDAIILLFMLIPKARL